MHILSLDWLAWMAGSTAAYWLAPPGLRHALLAALTGLFVAVHAPVAAFWLVAVSGLAYAGGSFVGSSGVRLVALLGALLAALVAYKVRQGLGSSPALWPGDGAAIPLGLSFTTFRAMHYAIERFKGRLPPHRPLEFLAYMFFLPTMLVGPIHRFPAFHRDLRRLRWSAQDLSAGLERILYGYVKVAVLCNVLVVGLMGRWIAGLPSEEHALRLYATMVQSGLRLYLLFAGFSDVAIGFARVLGFTIIENFDWPYAARNISEFWRRWHISLTSWVRDYVFETVTAATRRPALAMLTSLVLIGLWHEVSPRYLYWGLYHGAGVIVWHQFQRLKKRWPPPGGPALKPLRDLAARLLTVHFVWAGFILVERPTLAEVFDTWRVLLTGWF